MLDCFKVKSQMSVRLTIGHLCGPVNSVFEHIDLYMAAIVLIFRCISFELYFNIFGKRQSEINSNVAI